MTGYTDLSGGLLDIKIDGITEDTYDMYSGVPTNDVEFLTTGITVSAAGMATLECKINGVGTGGGWTAWFTMVSIWQTA